MNQINPKKLLGSKWTAIKPQKKEKHFLVVDIEYDEQDTVIACSIEAVMSKRIIAINWHDLKDAEQWCYGWR